MNHVVAVIVTVELGRPSGRICAIIVQKSFVVERQKAEIHRRTTTNIFRGSALHTTMLLNFIEKFDNDRCNDLAYSRQADD